MPHTSSRSQRAFTLVELLVVIGIISVLIAILLPALNKAREASKAAACASNLRQIHLGVVTYANEHDGWFNISGDVFWRVSPQGWRAWPGWHNFLHKYRLYNDPNWGFQVSRDYVKSAWVFLCPSSDAYDKPNIDGGEPTNNTYGMNYKVYQEGSPTDPKYPMPKFLREHYLENSGPAGRYMNYHRIKHPSEMFFITDSTGTNVSWWNGADYRHTRQNYGLNMMYADGHVQRITRAELTNPTYAFWISYGDSRACPPWYNR